MGGSMHVPGARFDSVDFAPWRQAPPSPSVQARNLMFLAQFVRLATLMPVPLSAAEVDRILLTLQEGVSHRSLRFSPEQGQQLADLIEFMAAQVAAQDLKAGGQP